MTRRRTFAFRRLPQGDEDEGAAGLEGELVHHGQTRSVLSLSTLL